MLERVNVSLPETVEVTIDEQGAVSFRNLSRRTSRLVKDITGSAPREPEKLFYCG